LGYDPYTNTYIIMPKAMSGKKIKYSIFQTSFKTKRLITRIYNILLGNEDIPISQQNVFYKNKTYTDKVFNKAIDDMLKDSER